jgi:RHS repeat-associated protein
MRAGIFVTTAATTIVQIVPAWAGNRLPKPVKIDWNAQLPKGLAQCLTPAQWKLVEAQRAKAAIRPAVRLLSAKEMRSHRGAGEWRNKYFSGTLPWTRSFRDVDLCNGNLFKSFTDIQVQGGHGAGLALQRTYNSDDDRVGPFGVGWTHAYDIRNEEENPTTNGTDASLNYSDRQDFFGARHAYHRDADGLYTPPPYLYDEHDSTYMQSLANGPLSPADDDDIGPDGTVKHYLADSQNTARWCDYIEDRYANPVVTGIAGNSLDVHHATVLHYTDQTVGGQTFHCLDKVTDPSGRTLALQWANVANTTQPPQPPLMRIVQIDGPQYSVVYDYDRSTGNLTSSTLDAASPSQYVSGNVVGASPHQNRTTTYTYSTASGKDYNNNSESESGLLASVTDPLGEMVSYQYAAPNYGYSGPGTGTPSAGEAFATNSLWVSQISEPAGVLPGTQTARFNVWTISGGQTLTQYGLVVSNQQLVGQTYTSGGIGFTVFPDQNLRFVTMLLGYINQSWYTRAVQYDSANNVTLNSELAFQPLTRAGLDNTDCYTYSSHGNMLKHWKVVTGGQSDQNTADVYTYNDASGYFQKKTATDMNGRVTKFFVGTDQGVDPENPNSPPNVGNRGNVLWVQDAGYSDPASPSYGQQYGYTYNNYGQKVTETNLKQVTTQYTYGGPTDYGYQYNDPNAALGDLTQVVQDIGSGHLNRTTTLTYDIAGHVIASQDPAGLQSSFTHNNLGQPTIAVFPNNGGIAGEVVDYHYDGNGRTNSVHDGRGTTVFTYEAGSNRVTSVTDPVTGTLSYTYLLNGERNTMTLPGGGVWTYAYAAGNQGMGAGNTLIPKDDPNSVCMALAGITDDQGSLIQFWLETNGRPDRTWTNEAWTTTGNNPPVLAAYQECDYTYDQPASNNTHGWLKQLQNTYNVLGGATTTLSQNIYTYDNVGQRLTNQVTLGGVTKTETYSYDDLNRLARVNYGDGETQSYTFDAMGNRVGKTDSVNGNETYTYSNANMLLTRTVGSTTTNYTSDADGNTLSLSGTGGRTSTWDSENRMVSCTLGSNTSSYVYGVDGIRRQSTVNGTTTYSMTDNSMMIRELSQPVDPTNNPTGSPVATYLQGAQGPVYRRNDTTNVVAWYVYDGLGSVVAEVSPAGAVNEWRKYDVYGVTRTTSNPCNPTSRQGFVGQLGHTSEPENGLIYMQSRYMDPLVGRFVSEDQGRQGANWFAYCSNNPVNGGDPTGNDWVFLADVACWLAILAPPAASIALTRIEKKLLELGLDPKKFLLRASSGDTPEQLLRGSSGNNTNTSSDELLRGSSSNDDSAGCEQLEAQEVVSEQVQTDRTYAFDGV